MRVAANEVGVNPEGDIREGCRGWELIHDDVVNVHCGAGEADGDRMVGFTDVVGRIVPCPGKHLGDIDCVGSSPGMNVARRTILPIGPLVGRRERQSPAVGMVFSGGIIDCDVDEFGGDRDDWREKA